MSHSGKNVSRYCPWPETLWKVEFKGYGLIILEDETSRQLNIQDIAWYFWLLSAKLIGELGAKSQQKNLKNFNRCSEGTMGQQRCGC